MLTYPPYAVHHGPAIQGERIKTEWKKPAGQRSGKKKRKRLILDFKKPGENGKLGSQSGMQQSASLGGRG
jgi:hypothetical protein